MLKIRLAAAKQRAREVEVRRCILNDIKESLAEAQANVEEGGVVREDQPGLPPWQQYFRNVQNNLDLE